MDFILSQPAPWTQPVFWIILIAVSVFVGAVHQLLSWYFSNHSSEDTPKDVLVKPGGGPSYTREQFLKDIGNPMMSTAEIHEKCVAAGGVPKVMASDTVKALKQYREGTRPESQVTSRLYTWLGDRYGWSTTKGFRGDVSSEKGEVGIEKRISWLIARHSFGKHGPRKLILHPADRDWLFEKHRVAVTSWCGPDKEKMMFFGLPVEARWDCKIGLPELIVSYPETAEGGNVEL